MFYHPLACLEPMGNNINDSIKERLSDGHYGKLRDLQWLALSCRKHIGNA
jgi:hypothetical protein